MYLRKFSVFEKKGLFFNSTLINKIPDLTDIIFIALSFAFRSLVSGRFTFGLHELLIR